MDEWAGRYCQELCNWFADSGRMRSASNRDVFQSHLQVLHVHVLLVAPLGAGHMSQLGTDQHQGRVSVRERPHSTGPAADFTIQAFNHIVGAVRAQCS